MPVYVVQATSLESIRRMPQRSRRPDAATFDGLPEAEKPKPTDLALFFTYADAVAFASRLHASWFRPAVVERSVDARDMHPLHNVG